MIGEQNPLPQIKPARLLSNMAGGLFLAVSTVQVVFPTLNIPFVNLLTAALSMVDFICHEMGHVVFGFAGEFIAILGGTMGQLFLPTICLFLSLRRRKWGQVTVFVFWIGQSLIQISTYIRDARSQSLKLFSPGALFGGGHPIHDWHYMLEKTGLLPADQFLGWMVFLAGLSLMLSAAGFLFARGAGLIDPKN